MKNVSVLGAGGHTRSLIPLLEHSGYRVQNIYDPSWKKDSQEFICGVPLSGGFDKIPEDELLVISSGDNEKRFELFAKFTKQLLVAPLFHHSAIVEKNAQIGRASQIFAHVVLNTESVVGENCLINTGAIIEHESKVGKHCHISVGSILCGRVKVGDTCFIGAGAVIINSVSICSGVTVGANSTVIRDIIEPGIYVGSPAIKVK